MVINQKDIIDIKIVLLGNVAVGKSSIMQRFVNDKFDIKQETTVGASYMARIESIHGSTIKF